MTTTDTLTLGVGLVAVQAERSSADEDAALRAQLAELTEDELQELKKLCDLTKDRTFGALTLR
jgi:hypothetical protein